MMNASLKNNHSTKRELTFATVYLLQGQRVVDSKFNQVILTPDTHFIVDWHPEHENVLLAGGCSGHLFKHGPVFGQFTAGGATRLWHCRPFKIAGRRYPQRKSKRTLELQVWIRMMFFAFLQNIMLLSEYNEYFFKEKSNVFV